MSDEELMDDLARVGATVFCDRTINRQRARFAEVHGIRYFTGYATAGLRERAEAHKTRLAVDRTGKTCLQRFADCVVAGGRSEQAVGFLR